MSGDAQSALNASQDKPDPRGRSIGVVFAEYSLLDIHGPSEAIQRFRILLHHLQSNQVLLLPLKSVVHYCSLAGPLRFFKLSSSLIYSS